MNVIECYLRDRRGGAEVLGPLIHGSFYRDLHHTHR